MENRTINIVAKYASEYAGNFVPSLLEVANRLKDDYRVVFSFPIESQNRYWVNYIIKNGYEVFFFGDNFKKDLKRINRLNDASITYTHFVSGLRVKLAYLFNRKMKLIIHVHSDFSANRKISFSRKLKNFVEHHIIRTDAKYVYVSKSLRDKNPFKNHFYVPNALCVNRVPCNDFNVLDFFCRNGIDQSDTLFLLFGWSPYVKGIDVAVKAFEYANSTKINSNKLIIVHGRDDGYSRCIEFLKSKIGNDEFLKNRNIIFTEPIRDTWSLYNICDVFVSSSRSEGFSYSILEAMYFGLNIIASDIDGTSYVKKHPNSCFYDVEDYYQLASLFRDSFGFKKVNHVNNKIADEYSLEKWCNSILTIVRE